MTQIAIEVHNLTKRYRIGLEKSVNDTLIGALNEWILSPIKNLVRLRRLARLDGVDDASDIITALDGVSFSVDRGEVVGIIGHNGAGKSTLLKILSRITDPTGGRALIGGRVSSLLEVGTGFHTELTGRENIYLNGTLLGMSRQEVDEKFDQIVAFSGIGKFLDTPVKRYSSGMRVRLAFAVAAHLEPEILLIDEVLAVGDMAFQKKCLGKMDEVASGGRTVLFVSHNMQMVGALCPRTILLDHGQIVADGETSEVLGVYQQRMRSLQIGAETAVENSEYRRGNGAVRFTDIVVENDRGQVGFRHQQGDTVRVHLSYEVFAQVDELQVALRINAASIDGAVSTIRYTLSDERLLPSFRETVTIELPRLNLMPGTYPLYFWLGDAHGPFDVVDNLTSPLILAAGSASCSEGLVELASSLHREAPMTVEL